MNIIAPDTTEAIRPLQHVHIPWKNDIGARRAIDILLYGGHPKKGSRDPLFNWTLGRLRTQEDVAENPQLVKKLVNLAEKTGIYQWYAPIPTEYNGRIADPDDFRDRDLIRIGDGVELYRGVNADGVILSRRMGFLMSSGGNPILVATDGDITIVAQAGLECIMPRKNPALPSTVYTVCKHFPVKKGVRAWTFFGLRPELYTHSPTHPVYGARNRRILDDLRQRGFKDAIYGKECGIDMVYIVRRQLLAANMPRDTGSPNSYLSPKAFHARAPVPYNTYRNLIAVAYGGLAS